MTSQKLRRFDFSLLHFKHKTNDFAAKLIRAVSFNVSDGIRGGKSRYVFLAVKRQSS